MSEGELMKTPYFYGVTSTKQYITSTLKFRRDKANIPISEDGFIR